MRVSVALATYDGGRYLGEQLASLLAQTRLPDELVVGDDGSSDDTLALLEDFAAHAPFPVLITCNPANLGHAANFVATLRRCEGAVVFPCDQDDIWHPVKIARMLDFLSGNPGLWLAAHDAALVDAEGCPLGLTMGGQVDAVSGYSASLGIVAGCSMAIDRRLLALLDGNPRLRQHDAWLAEAARLLGLRGYLPEPLIDYRRHGTNASQSFMSDERPASLWALWRERLARARVEPVRDALTAAIAAREDMVAAFERHSDELVEAVPQDRLAAVLAAERAALSRDRRRLAIHEGPRLLRLPRLAGAALAGTYRGGQGMLSLLRDLGGLLA